MHLFSPEKKNYRNIETILNNSIISNEFSVKQAKTGCQHPITLGYLGRHDSKRKKQSARESVKTND